MPIASSEKAREMADRAKSVRTKLTLEDVTAVLGALDTPEDAKRWLRQLTLWTSAGKIAGVPAGACVRAVAEWQKVYDAALDRDRIKQLEATVRDLEAELTKVRGSSIRRAG